MLKSEAEPLPLGDVGEPSPAQAVTSVASVAQDATWQAPAQNWRREMGVVVSDISSVIPGGESPWVGQ
jgi:hypothetical protein